MTDWQSLIYTSDTLLFEYFGKCYKVRWADWQAVWRGLGARAYQLARISGWFGAAARVYRLACLGESKIKRFALCASSCIIEFLVCSHWLPLFFCRVDVLQSAEADAIVEEFELERMTTVDEESQSALWNNRLFPCQKLGVW